MNHHEGTAAGVSLVTMVTSFISGAIPVLQGIALAVSIISGVLAIIGAVRRFIREP